MIKAVFFDIDGTLLSFNTHRIPESALLALAALRNKGILLFISTGRPYADTAFLREFFRFDGYITLNGQYCLNEKGVIYKRSMARQDVEVIVEQVVRGEYICSFVNENGSFISGTDETVRNLFGLVNVKIPPVKDPKTALEEEIYQVSVFLDRSQEHILLDRATGVRIARWHDLFTDVIPAGGGKQKGMEAVLQYYGISAEDSMAFGDGENDLSMLEYVKTGVAMGNASEKVKRAADYVTASVDEDGILKALLHLGVLEEKDIAAAQPEYREGGPADKPADKSAEERADECPEDDCGEDCGNDWQERTGILLGKEGVEKLAASSVAVIGVGGVGGYAAEMLCRAGIGRLVLVDADRVHATNKNRQIIALDSTMGDFKTRAMARRLRDINPQAELILKEEYLDEGNVSGLLSGERIDFIVDAIDTLSPKIALIRYCVENKIPHVTSMGAGAKLDATAVRIADISKSYNCPLAYVLRKKLRKAGISKGFPVVFSEELPDRNAIVPVEERNKKSRTGTISYLPAVFGCACTQAAIEFLLREFLIDK